MSQFVTCLGTKIDNLIDGNNNVYPYDIRLYIPFFRITEEICHHYNIENVEDWKAMHRDCMLRLLLWFGVKWMRFIHHRQQDLIPSQQNMIPSSLIPSSQMTELQLHNTCMLTIFLFFLEVIRQQMILRNQYTKCLIKTLQQPLC